MKAFILASLCLIYCAILSSMSQIYAIEKFSVGELDIAFGEKEGINESSDISNETLQKILAGVENGNKDNIYYFGLLKLYGIAVSKDLTVAAQNFNRASSLGHKEGTTAYGVMLMSGHGMKKDLAMAMKYFRKGVELGDMNSYWLLGKMLMEGKGLTVPSYSEAAALFHTAAEENVPQAQYSLALMYEYGMGVEQNFHLAAKFYQRAVEQHHIESIYNLALMYTFGRGFEQDFQKARSLLEKSAQSNHAPSVYYIGIFKTYGYGCDIQYYQAINWFERAAGLDDYRVSSKASKAAEELRSKMDEAHLHNERLMDSLQKKGTTLQ